MARTSVKTLLESCTQATSLANTISVRMLEYLSAAKTQPQGFRELATDFLDICRILWPIETCLSQGISPSTPFPTDIMQEVERKLRQTRDNFTVLNQMLVKFVDYEKKGGFGRLQKGFRMMFADSDVHKVRTSLATNKTALKMSSLALSCVVGELKANASMGYGITGLVAVLKSMEMPEAEITMQPESQTQSQAQLTPPTSPPELPLPPIPASIPRSSSSASSPPMSPYERQPEPMPMHIRQHTPRAMPSPRLAPSPVSSGRLTGSTMRDSTMVSGSEFKSGIPDDLRSNSTFGSLTQFEDILLELETDKITNQTLRLRGDTKSVPRWTPKQTIGAHSADLTASLVDAVRSKDHKTLEELLDYGVLPESVPEVNLLVEAVANQDVASIRLLLLFGANPNTIDRHGLTPLLSATDICFLDGAKMLLKYGADPALCTGSDSENPLALSVVGSRYEFAQLYLKYGGDPNQIMPSGNTPFIKAINKTTPAKLIDLFLSHNANVNGKNAEGQSPLLTAIAADRIDLVTLLLDHSADPNLPGPKHALWPSTFKPPILALLLSRGAQHKKAPGIMELATSMNNLDSIRILLQAGVNPNVKKDGVYTPLCSAIRDDRLEIITVLLANGADPNVPASEYPAFKCVTHKRMHLLPTIVAAGADLHRPKGILETAVQKNDKEALLYLLDNGVNPNDKAHDTGFTPLTTAIRDDRAELVDILLSRGADPTVRGQDWPLSMAVKNRRDQLLEKLLTANPTSASSVRGSVELAVGANSLACVKLLLKAGVNVEEKTGGVFSPLTTAIREDRNEIVKFLLDEAGANVNAPGEHLPLVKALRRYRDPDGHTDTGYIEMLLARGADINLMYRGWNPILQAVENGDEHVLKLMLEKNKCGGVDLQRKDEEGRTVVELVREKGWEEGVNMLLIDDDEKRGIPN